MRSNHLLLFSRAYPGFTGLWLFDNATNHSAFGDDALVAARVQLAPGGKQPWMKDGQFGNPPQRQAMNFQEDHPFFPGQPKGAKVILQEPGLWREGLRLACAAKAECNVGSSCRARSILAAQPDFAGQRSAIEEYLVSKGQLVLYFPKFHCELNWIEMFWGACKRHARDKCTFDIRGLAQADAARRRRDSEDFQAKRHNKKKKKKKMPLWAIG